MIIKIVLGIFCFIFSVKAFTVKRNSSKINPMENEGFFEGDIAGVDPKGLVNIPNANSRKWPGGIVPYEIAASNYSNSQIQTIREGMRWIEQQTRLAGRNCIRFVRRTDQPTYVKIFNGDGCWSYIGKQSRIGPQLLSLKKPTSASPGSCLYPGIVAHELSHALGIWHEQSRPDRDNFVRIVWENIATNARSNFNKYTTGVDTLGSPYDYYSIMHYESKAFSVNGKPTIIPLKQGVDLISAALKKSLTAIDVDVLRKYYNCR